MRVLRGLGLTQTYVDAQRVVTALERAQSDPGYFNSAAEILNSYVEPERTEVVNKAIALGADPEILRSLLVQGETIEVHGDGPIVSVGTKRYQIKWWHAGLGLLGIVGIVLGVKKYRAARRLV